ncbi:hypothetical protein A2U01_0098489, partial [Trifolium medium]|nr:hypothetical protein [Trifolium medium]
MKKLSSAHYVVTDGAPSSSSAPAPAPAPTISQD